MKRVLTNYRYYILVALSVIVIAGILAIPEENLPTGSWVYCLLSSKIIALAAGYLAYRLYWRWARKGTIPELCRFIYNF